MKLVVGERWNRIGEVLNPFLNIDKGLVGMALASDPAIAFAEVELFLGEKLEL